MINYFWLDKMPKFLSDSTFSLINDTMIWINYMLLDEKQMCKWKVVNMPTISIGREICQLNIFSQYLSYAHYIKGLYNESKPNFEINQQTLQKIAEANVWHEQIVKDKK